MSTSTSTSNTSTSTSNTSNTYTMYKRTIVVDDIQGRRTNTKRKDIKTKPVDIDTLLQQQRAKEKQLLKQWKAARADGKKTRLIVRKKAHDVSRGEKQRFSEIDENEG
jgi:hypothetical protein